MQLFVGAMHEVPHVNHEFLAGIMQQNLRQSKFKESIIRRPPLFFEELLCRAEKYIRIEETTIVAASSKRKDRDDERKYIHGERTKAEELC